VRRSFKKNVTAALPWRRLAQATGVALAAGFLLAWGWVAIDLIREVRGGQPKSADLLTLELMLPLWIAVFVLFVDVVPALLLALVAVGCERRIHRLLLPALLLAAPLAAWVAGAIYVRSGVHNDMPFVQLTPTQPMTQARFVKLWLWESGVAVLLWFWICRFPARARLAP
jgi:hypothetical protein